ncbi:MAG: hypothetical protein MUF01_15085 [Bryobacterales bacterium]|jgi:hypothetical protein|nr:hypothetical protein [Bryobacterales bacterium]
MQIGDLLARTGAGVPAPDHAAERAAAQAAERARLQALLPSSGIHLHPPETEDKLYISPLTHTILRAGEALDSERLARVEQLRARYLQGGWEVDDFHVAARMLPGLSSGDKE